MHDLKELKDTIEKLSPKEFEELRKWIIERDWELWDKQIEKDSESGKLDFLIEEAEKELREGKGAQELQFRNKMYLND